MHGGGQTQPVGQAKGRMAAQGAALTANRPQGFGETFDISLEGEVDLSQRAALRALAAAFASDAARNAAVDLSRVTFMDSTGLGFLVRVRRISRSRGGQVALTNPQAIVLRLLRTTHLDQLFEIQSN